MRAQSPSHSVPTVGRGSPSATYGTIRRFPAIRHAHTPRLKLRSLATCVALLVLIGGAPVTERLCLGQTAGAEARDAGARPAATPAPAQPDAAPAADGASGDEGRHHANQAARHRAYRELYRLLQTGRYEDVLQRTQPTAQTPLVLLRVRALRALSRHDAAIAELSGVLVRGDALAPRERAALLAERARLQLERGRLVNAKSDAESAIAHDPEQPVARFVRARVLAETGRIEEATAAFRWFVRFYNRVQPTDAETLIWVARGAATYARWESISQIFHFSVNTLCPDILAADPLAWEAHWICGALLLEKYNRAQAIPELQQALAINPRAVEVLVALAKDAIEQREPDQALRYARQALQIAPGTPSAWEVIGDVALAAGDFSQALECFRNALQTNRRSQSALAGWVAAELLRRGEPAGFRVPGPLALWLRTSRPQIPEARLPVSLQQLRAVFPAEPSAAAAPELSTVGAIVQSQLHRNPRAAVFLGRLGERLEAHRRFAAAAACYREAAMRMPQYSPPLVALGLLAMQVGRFDAARPILDAAFNADPFHVRVANLRKVLAQLQRYRRHRTPHFLVYHTAGERLLAECAAEYLETIYPELTQQFGFAPQSPTQIEIYADGDGQTAHQWFSARMVGLPWIQTIGASTGLVIAMASPQSGRGFNWGRVLRHEFVHVITLQQTDFRMPHWFTEALAVREEIRDGYAEPDDWMGLLERRLQSGTLFSLRELDRGFQHPRGPGDWTLAYCQSYLLARYLEEHHGPGILSELIAASARGEDIFGRLQRRIGEPLDELTRRYVGWIDRRLHREPPAIAPAEPGRLDIDAALGSGDPRQVARAAYALLRQRRFERARSAAEKAVQATARPPWLAVYVLAQLEARAGNLDGAIELLQDAAREHAPAPVIDLVAELHRRRGDRTAAIGWYRTGLERFPEILAWHKALAALLIEQGEDSEELYRTLQFIAAHDAETRTVPLKLLQMARRRGDWAASVRYAWRSLFVDVRHAPAHRVLALDAARQNDGSRALRFWQRANEVGDATDVGWQWELAAALRDRGHLAAARTVAAAILEHAPEHAEAAQLLQQAP